MPPKRGTKRAASELSTSDNSGTPEGTGTTHQRATKTARHAPPQASGARAQQVPTVCQGRDILQRTLLSHSTKLRSTSFKDVSADFALTQIEWRNDVINALRVVAYHHREGTKISRWCGPSPMPRLEKGMVDEMFTGEAIAGSNWKCEVVQHTVPKKNIECAIYWLVEKLHT